MPLNIRRPGVPPKPKETKFVDQLIEYAATPATPARRSFRKPPPAKPAAPESGDPRWAEARAALRAEIAGMTDAEFDAFLEDIGAAGVSFMADAYRRERK